MRFIGSLFSATVYVLLVPLVVVAATVQLTQTSKTTYSITYSGFKDIGGVQVFLYYDPVATNIQGLDQGRVVRDAQGQFSAHDNKTGMANFAAITTNGFPDKDGSLLATVTLGGTDPRITTSRVTLTSTHARPLPSPTVQVVSLTPPPTIGTGGTGTGGTGTGGTGTGGIGTGGTGAGGTGTGGTGTGGTGTGGTGTGGTGTGVTVTGGGVTGGTVTLPSDPLAPPATPAKPEERSVELQVLANPANAAAEGDTARKPETTKATEAKSVVYKSILQRFIDNENEPTPALLIGLFVDPVEPAIKQTPAIAYAGDVSPLRVTVNSAILTTASPTLLLKGAKLVELGTEGDFWVVDAKSQEKAVDGRLVIQDGERALDMPLVIVPKIKLAKDKAGKVDPAEFGRVLADRGEVKKVKYDFNGDGKHDAIDDYIYTANYIEQTGLTPSKPKEVPKAKDAPKAAEEKKPVASKEVAPAGVADSAPAAEPKKKKKKK